MCSPYLCAVRPPHAFISCASDKLDVWKYKLKDHIFNPVQRSIYLKKKKKSYAQIIMVMHL